MKCWVCGKEATKRRNIGTREIKSLGVKPFEEYKQRCYCDECFSSEINRVSEETKKYVKLRKRLMYERAVDMLEHQNINLYEYEEAIKAVGEFVEENPDKFDSSYEMIAAVFLINEEIECRMQFPVGKYRVDFCLPDLHVVLEIDGERHTVRKEYDSKRDIAIKKQLGDDWEIIRIGTKFIDQNAEKIVDAVYAVLDDRIKCRNKISKLVNK